jgi:hypothetical protein
MFEVGDKVKIKSWEQMEEEFGLDKIGDIECAAAFLVDMKHLCGQEIEIEMIGNSCLDDYKKIQNIEGWAITFDMIEKI